MGVALGYFLFHFIQPLPGVAECPKLIDTFPNRVDPSPNDPSARAGYTLSRTGQVIYLLFDSRVYAPTLGSLQVRELRANGAYGDTNLGGLFNVSVELDPGGEPNMLKVVPATPGSRPLTERTWYSASALVRGSSASDCPFALKFLNLPGDANNDWRVNANDLSFVNSRIAPRPGVPWDWNDTIAQQRYRSNVNADNFVNANDLSAVNSRIHPLAVPVPSGHTPGIQK